MSLLTDLAERLPTKGPIDYAPGASGAAEPTAVLALAYLAAGFMDRAGEAADWLAGAQRADGAITVRPSEEWPKWPTALAVLAWHCTAKERYAERIKKAVDWTLKFESKKMTPDGDVGHDVTIIAWPWAEGTHCWIEPTALHLLSLRAVGKEQHLRYRDGVRVLLDRQLPNGGCNYGNTTVLGQLLRPHLLPSSLALLALAGEPREPAILKSVAYLRRTLREPQTLIGSAWAWQAAIAYQDAPLGAEAALAKFMAQVDAEDKNPYHYALLTLAAAGAQSPIVQLAVKGKPE
jgi:hypothetical protein